MYHQKVLKYLNGDPQSAAGGTSGSSMSFVLPAYILNFCNIVTFCVIKNIVSPELNIPQIC